MSDKNKALTKPAQNLLRDMLEYALYAPNIITDKTDFTRERIWDNLQDNPESAFRELELLANPVEREEMTAEEHQEYTESRTAQIRSDGL